MIVRRAFQSSVKTCLNKTGATQEQIDLFNSEQDVTNLPKGHELSCYMHCQLHEMDLMDANGTDIRFEVALQHLRLLRPEHQNIYMNMGKKCFNRRFQSPDPCEVAYLWSVCLKRGDLKVSANNNAYRPILHFYSVYRWLDLTEIFRTNAL